VLRRDVRWLRRQIALFSTCQKALPEIENGKHAVVDGLPHCCGVAHGESPANGLVLEEDVTVGHGAILHGARIEKGCLIGMGAILLSGSVIGAGSLVAAGSVVREYCQIPSNCLAAGNPAEVKKTLQGNAARWTANAADEYSRLAQRYNGSQRIVP